MRLPPGIAIRTAELPRSYLYQRQQQSIRDSYKGIPMAKMPEDLWVYSQLIWDVKPEVIVELGTFQGGSAVWFVDQMAVMTPHVPSVITVDVVECAMEHPQVHKIVEGLEDAADQVHTLCADKRVMVIEDSAHTYASTSAALRLYHDLIPSGSYFVIEDGIVDEPYCLPAFPGTVQPAIETFLEHHAEFRQHDYRPYGLGMNVNGYLERL